MSDTFEVIDNLAAMATTSSFVVVVVLEPTRDT